MEAKSLALAKPVIITYKMDSKSAGKPFTISELTDSLRLQSRYLANICLALTVADSVEALTRVVADLDSQMLNINETICAILTKTVK